MTEPNAPGDEQLGAGSKASRHDIRAKIGIRGRHAR
jgi:hypothetical protein